MAIKCPNCGQVLPKDNAKFCNSCGVALPPEQAQGTGAAINRPPTGFPTRPGLYEQIAQQPPVRPPGASRSRPPGPPAWMRTLDRGVAPRFIEGAGNPPEPDEATQRVPYSRNRELHSSVWENKESDNAPRGQEVPTFSEEDTISPDESPVFEGSVEDLPTAHVEATLPKPHLQRSPGMQKTREFNDAPQESAIRSLQQGSINRPPTAEPRREASLQAGFQEPPQEPSPAMRNPPAGDVAQLPTNRLTSQGPVKPGDPSRQPEAVQFRPRPMQPGGVIFQRPPSTPQLGAVPQSQAPVSMGTSPVRRQGMSRRRMMLVLALLVVLVIGGVAAWIIAARPFAVASITQPWQQFCDSGLGVAGQYPTGWTKSVDASRGVHFSDGTDQFSIGAFAANGQDAATYLREEASRLGITGLKVGSPISFAGTSWQQAQGSLLQGGVTYTETLLVTMHNNQFFTVMQIAPPGTYNEEDATIFSGMRSSFRFSNNCS